MHEATRQTGHMAMHPAERPQGTDPCGRYLRVRRCLVVVLALVAQVGLLGAGVPPPALADASVTLDGHGNGHGYGLSQWGAYGYAVDYGWSSAQILDHYYGATVAGTVPLETTIAVRLTKLDDLQTAVVTETGGLLVDGVAGGPWKSALAREVSAPGSPAVYAVWARADAQVCPAETGDPVAAGWTLIAPSMATQVTIRSQADSATTSLSQLAAVCESTGPVRSYRGVIRAVNGSAGENRTVNELPIEQYLRAVVAKEVSPGWAAAGGGRGAQALQAQAVAARSYGLAENRFSYAKTCDLTCQYYLGAASRTSTRSSTYTAVEHPATDAAVLATVGMVRRLVSNGGIALTMFAASSGGWTKPGPTDIVPFPAVIDQGDSTSLNPAYDWSVTIQGAVVTSKYPAIGTFSRVTVLTRNGLGDWGGRVNTVKITGSAGQVIVTGDQFRSAFGLKSDWFNVQGSTQLDPCFGRNAPAVGAAQPSSAAARYAPLTPVRLIDTRNGIGTTQQPIAAGCTLVVDPGLDPSVTAVAVNLTAVSSSASGFLTAYPCAVERPVASVVQAVAQRTIAGSTVVPLGADGTFCVYTSTATHLLVDLFGAYSPAAGQKFEPTAPTRVLDSRSAGARLAAGTVVTIPLNPAAGVPAGSSGVALSVQAIDPTGAGFVTVFPCSPTMPVVSSLNVASSANIANHVEVGLSATGTVCVYVSSAMHIIVDLSGWYGAGATTEFHALTPVRALDTRNGIGLSGSFSPMVSRAFTLAGTNGLPAAATVRAVVAEVTAVEPTSAGYLTVHPCEAVVPQVSMVQTWGPANAASTVIGVDDDFGRWCILTSASMHVLVDVSGYFS